MARLIFPDEGSRLVFRLSGTGKPLLSASAGVAVVYADANASVLADIRDMDGATLPGSTLQVNELSQLPLFYGPDNVDTVWVRVDGGPVSPVYARADDRLDALGAQFKGATVVKTVNGNSPDANGNVQIASGGVVDASNLDKGVLLLAGDLGGTADSPTTPTAVHVTGAETINGVKTFNDPPVVPDGSFTLNKVALTGARDASTVLLGDGTLAERYPYGTAENPLLNAMNVRQAGIPANWWVVDAYPPAAAPKDWVYLPDGVPATHTMVHQQDWDYVADGIAGWRPRAVGTATTAVSLARTTSFDAGGGYINAALTWSTNAAGSTAVEQSPRLNVGGSKAYTLTAWVRHADTAVRNALCSIDEFDSAGAFLRTTAGTATSIHGNSWVKINVSVTTGATTTAARLSVQLDAMALGVNCYLDRVRLMAT